MDGKFVPLNYAKLIVNIIFSLIFAEFLNTYNTSIFIIKY